MNRNLSKMFTLVGTLVFYDIIMITCFIMCHAYEKSKRKIYKYIPYIILFFVSVFRYDIGADYENMYWSIEQIAKNQIDIDLYNFVIKNASTPGYTIFVLLLKGLPMTSFWVIGLYSLFFLCSIYYVLDRYNSHKWGILVLFLSLLIFQSWDWVKQSAAIGLVACSLVYVDRGNIVKAALFLSCAIFFHLSAFFALPILLSKKIKLSSRLMAYILIGVFVLAELGAFNTIYNQLLLITPFYNEVYSTSIKYQEMTSFSYLSTTFILFSLWSIFVTYFSSKKTSLFNFLFFIGSSLYMISGGSLLIDRISVYYTLSQIIVIPAIVSMRHNDSFKIIFGAFILANLLLINRRFVEYGDIRGCVPYESVFSDEFENKIFRIRY